MSKKHWNSVYFHKDVPVKLMQELVVKSYDLVVKGLTRKEREALQQT